MPAEPLTEAMALAKGRRKKKFIQTQPIKKEDEEQDDDKAIPQKKRGRNVVDEEEEEEEEEHSRGIVEVNEEWDIFELFATHTIGTKALIEFLETKLQELKGHKDDG